jgi:hypothetical protein
VQQGFQSRILSARLRRGLVDPLQRVEHVDARALAAAQWH